MKKQWKWILTAAALIAVLAAAALLYRSLSERYTPPAATTVPASQSNADEDSAAPTERTPDAEQAADFVVFDENNAEVRLSDHFGKPLVVNFWASWCGPCRSELPAFDAAAKQYADEIGFMMVNLTDGFSETVSSVKAFLAENGYTFPVYFDARQDAASAYGAYSIPLTVFIRADGTVMDSYLGAMDEDTLQSYLAQLLA